MTNPAQEWKKCASYEGGYDESSPTVQFFWEAVASFSAEEVSQLLAFCRGSSALPAEGFEGLGFVLRRVEGPERLPVAHTCEFSLDLPKYGSVTELCEKLRRAMLEETFGLA